MFKWLLGAVALVGALGGLVWLYGHQMDRARDDGATRERTIWQAREKARADVQAEVERGLATRMGQRFDDLTATLLNVRGREAEINVRLPQAIAAAPRYRDPECALTTDVLEQLNAARALTAAP